MMSDLMPEFVRVAATSEIQPGDRLIVELGRDWVAIFNVDGMYYAVQDICTHDDGPLAEGELIGCEIECPRHGARFDIRTGKVTAPPALVDVPTYEVRVDGDHILIARR
jgi:3-phenylpropionate/trans-cinnamate dioxygenase ferredoxin subunit